VLHTTGYGSYTHYKVKLNYWNHINCWSQNFNIYFFSK